MLNNLKALRTKAEMTQQELADRVGVTRSMLAMWETNSPVPGGEKLPRLAEALGVTIDELFNGDQGQKRPNPPAPVFTLRTLFPILNAKYVALFLHYSESITARVDFDYSSADQIHDILHEFGDFPIRAINFRDINNSPHVIIELERPAEGGTPT